MKILIVSLCLISIQAFSKTLIVSDIDDTIKISHVRNTTDIILNAYLTTASFRGMSETYQLMLNEIPDSEIIYVTNANDLLMHSSHTKFIKNNKFPKGKIYFRNSSPDVHKYNTIKSLLEKNSYDQLIMIGDNGERDIEFYARIQNEFQNRVLIKTYIRVAYSTPTEVLALEPEQLGFISPLEILADLTGNEFITRENYFSLANKLAGEIVTEGKVSSKKPQYFPSWLNCKDMDFYTYPQLMTAEIEKAYEKLHSLCQ